MGHYLKKLLNKSEGAVPLKLRNN